MAHSSSLRQSTDARSIAENLTIQSEAISRKTRYRNRAATVFEERRSELSSAFVPRKIPLGVDSKPAPIIPTPAEPSKQYLRPKNSFNGRYFPCFGFVCGGVLSGTSIFPLPPKQEKLHFMHATISPMDHLDGEPDNQYLDGILTHMHIKMEAWDYPNHSDFLDKDGPNFEKVIIIVICFNYIKLNLKLILIVI